MMQGARDLDFEVALLRTLLKSPNRSAALMARCMVALMIGDGRIELDERAPLPPDLAALVEELQAGRLDRQH